MSNSKHIQSFYRVSMEIGRSLDLFDMLKHSVSAYLKEFSCTTGIIYKINSTGDDHFTTEMIFSIPYALIARSTYTEIEAIVPVKLTGANLRLFQKKLPDAGIYDGDRYYHIFSLATFGFMVLIREEGFLDSDLVTGLRDINTKLATACEACVSHESLTESLQRYRHQQDLLPEMVCETNPEGIITFANNYALKKMGYSEADLRKGIMILDIIHPDDHKAILRNFKQALRRDKLPPHEYLLRKTDGSVFPVLIYTNRLKRSAKVEGLISIIVDITELKENERKLELYTERLELALLGSEAGLWDWDILTGEIYLSERSCSMLGYKQFELDNHVSSREALIHPDDRESVRSVLQEHLRGKTSLYKAEYRIQTKSGDWKWILDTGKVTIRDVKGKPLRAAGTHIDITERKQNEIIAGIENELGNKLSKAKSLHQTMKVCLETALHHSGMDCGGIYMEDEANDGFKLIQQLGLTDEFVRNTSFYSYDSPNARIIYEGKPVYSSHRDIIKKTGMKDSEVLNAMAVLPIVYTGKSIGCINIASRSKNDIPAFSRIVLEKIAQQIGYFIIQARNEEKLSQNREDLNTLFNTIDDFLFILDNEGKMIYFNSRVTERLGYTAGELMNKDVIMVHPEERHEEARTKIRGMLDGTENVCRVPLLTKTGEQIPVETNVKKGKWSGKDVIIGISRDTTERMKYERQIRENSERLEMALLGGDAGWWDWDISSNRVIMNERWFTMRGLKQQQGNFTIDTWTSLLHPDDRDSVMEALDRHFKKLTPFYQAEYRSATGDGSWKWILDTGKVMEYDREGKPLRMVGTNVNITSKKQNELMLQQNLKQQVILSEIALELNTMDDFDTRINTVVNRIGTHTDVSRVYIFENSEDGNTTTNAFEWCNKDIKPQKDILQNIPFEVIPSWKQLLIDDGVLYSENISNLPDDIRAILEPQSIKSLVVYPLFVQGNFFGFIGFDECSKSRTWSRTELELLRTVSGIISNAYERKIMEQSIIDERDRANNANRAKSEFLANMSHEIRTPMNAILGFSEALYHKLDSVQLRRMVQSVLNSGNLLLSLLNDILDLSKIEAGKLDITTQPVDLKNVLQEINLLFADKAQKKGIDVNIYIEPGFPGSLLLDEIRIKQVLFNLVGNAVKFTHKGYITVSVEFRKETANSGILAIIVEDTGIGIKDSQQELIFEAFRQQSGQSNRTYGGIGLGLAISKRLVEKMNGSINVASQESHGSIFTVILPGTEFRKSDSVRNSISELTEDITFEKATILVVDDVFTNIETIENLLSSEGLTITSAGSG
ncbi:MAG TPA: PAS domain S-box protein, partial [Bacteroidales bacterium]|nr:PAS domain S-box protein [Bacteroidales bacterium]